MSSAQTSKASSVRVRINSFRGKPVTTKTRLSDDPRHGNLFPGQVVDVSSKDRGAASVAKKLLQAEILVLTEEEPNRPLLYESYYEARKADPRFANREEGELERMQERVDHSLAMTELARVEEKKRREDAISTVRKG